MNSKLNGIPENFTRPRPLTWREKVGCQHIRTTGVYVEKVIAPDTCRVDLVHYRCDKCGAKLRPGYQSARGRRQGQLVVGVLFLAAALALLVAWLWLLG